MKKNLAWPILLPLVLCNSALAQWIPIRTVPVAAADQMSTVPSSAASMGGLSLAYEDSIADPFSNPASALRLHTTVLFLSPSYSGWNSEGHVVRSLAGSARYPGVSLTTVPAGMVIRTGDFALGGFVAHQAFTGKRKAGTGGQAPSGFLPTAIPQRDLGTNTFLSALAAKTFPEQQLDVGLLVRWEKFGALDGVWVLYPGNLGLSQNGSSAEVLASARQRLSEQDEVEVIAGWNSFRSSHEAVFASIPFGDIVFPTQRYHVEKNSDEMTQWVLSAGFRHFSERGWVFGAGLTVNWKDHPKIPNYRLMNIPRDPGTSVAYRIGAGMSWTGPRTVFGIEYVYEPIMSRTWAEAGGEWRTVGEPGVHTVDNTFLFSNHILRSGFETRTGIHWLRLRAGTRLRFNRYSLEQVYPLSGGSRSMDVDWLETSITAGATASFGNLDFVYALQLLFGTGLVGTSGMTLDPWIPWPTLSDGVMDARAVGNFLIAPSGELLVDNLTVAAHQVGLVYRFK
jgi:hypothetical protein